MVRMTLRLGTRGSALARAQSGSIAAALTSVARARGIDLDIELHILSTHGDESTGPLVGSETSGVFVTAVREALVSGECDLAVHSLKDMPVAPYEGITLAALPAREDSRDPCVLAESRLPIFPTARASARVLLGAPLNCLP